MKNLEDIKDIMGNFTLGASFMFGGLYPVIEKNLQIISSSYQKSPINCLTNSNATVMGFITSLGIYDILDNFLVNYFGYDKLFEICTLANTIVPVAIGFGLDKVMVGKFPPKIDRK